MNTKTREANQRLLNEAAIHINEQGVQSATNINDDGYQGCKYSLTRDESTIHCVFWPAIETYDERMEGQPASDLLSEWIGYLFDWAKGIDESFADAMQTAHDEIEVNLSNEQFISEFNARLCKIAERTGLETPSICTN